MSTRPASRTPCPRFFLSWFLQANRTRSTFIFFLNLNLFLSEKKKIKELLQPHKAKNHAKKTEGS
jgi:hypothetical protein